jgi:hypothetical protein
MKKEHDEYVYECSADMPNDPNWRVITQDDLEGDEVKIYDHYLAKLDNPSAEQLRMLATYSWLATKLKVATDNRKLALYIQRCMVYARNRIGLWKPEPVSPMELLLDDGYGFERTYYSLYLDREWEIEEEDITQLPIRSGRMVERNQIQSRMRRGR